jgi:phytoene dehydrogenase-like protein
LTFDKDFPMTHKPTALVIGAGIGGIATAARLAKNGYSVTVLEKNATPGGRCNQILRDGHRFDIGPTLFLMPEIWEETFAALGEKMSDHLELKRIDPTYKVHFDDGLQIELTSDIGKMQEQLENRFYRLFGLHCRGREALQDFGGEVRWAQFLQYF